MFAPPTSPLPMLLVPFEDSGALALRPLVDTRPVYGLRLGIRTTLETIQSAFPNATGTILHTRDYLAATTRAEYDLPANRIPAGVDVLFVNGRWIAGAGDALGRVEQATRGSARLFVQGDTVVAAGFLPFPTPSICRTFWTPRN